MSITWICVAHQSGARFLRSTSCSEPLEELLSIDHPDGRLKDGQLETDSPGSVVDTGGSGFRSLTSEQSASERLAEMFAKRIAQILQSNKEDYDDLVLVAPPRFLGRLRKAVTSDTASRIKATLDKDLPRLRPEELREQVNQVYSV